MNGDVQPIHHRGGAVVLKKINPALGGLFGNVQTLRPLQIWNFRSMASGSCLAPCSFSPLTPLTGAMGDATGQRHAVRDGRQIPFQHDGGYSVHASVLPPPRHPWFFICADHVAFPHGLNVAIHRHRRKKQLGPHRRRKPFRGQHDIGHCLPARCCCGCCGCCG